MNTDQRLKVGYALLQALREEVNLCRGDITDGVAVMALGFMNLHASMWIADGKDAADGLEDAISCLRERYADAWAKAAQAYAEHAKAHGQ